MAELTNSVAAAAAAMLVHCSVHALTITVRSVLRFKRVCSVVYSSMCNSEKLLPPSLACRGRQSISSIICSQVAGMFSVCTANLGGIHISNTRSLAMNLLHHFSKRYVMTSTDIYIVY